MKVLPAFNLVLSNESLIVSVNINRDLFQDHHEEDYFLYIAYSDESVYGQEEQQEE